MNPRYRKQAERIRSLIEEGREVARLEQPSSIGPYIQDHVRLDAWLVKTENIVLAVFGKTSPHYRRLKDAISGGAQHAYQINSAVGILLGALDDLEGGFLVGQEQLVAGEIFDSVLEEAQHLAEKGFKVPAAVLARVVVEDTLRRRARGSEIDDSGKASSVNDRLRDAGLYAKPQWRLIQTWLDIGNAAAHGDFSDYSADEVERMIRDVQVFLAQQLH